MPAADDSEAGRQSVPQTDQAMLVTSLLARAGIKSLPTELQGRTVKQDW